MAKNDPASPSTSPQWLNAVKFSIRVVGSSAKYIVSGVLGSIVLLNPSHIPLYYVCGGIMNTLTGKAIKHTLRHPRPSKSKKPGYGMPSSHAQALFYLVTTSCLLLTRDSISPWKVAVSLGLVSYAAVGAYYRILADLHTPFQTMVGTIFGCSAAWVVYSMEAPVHIWLLNNVPSMVQGGMGSSTTAGSSLPTVNVPFPIRFSVVCVGAVVVLLVKRRFIDF